MPAERIGEVDIARLNLLCAEGLPGAEQLDVTGTLTKLDLWAKWVKHETDRHLYRLEDPRYAKDYGGSQARLRCELLVEVLQKDFRVRYNPERAADSSWRDSRDLFLRGLVAEGQGGTCLSMPALYVAVGRRLGYPMFLVPAKSYVFCRWEGPDECLNMDGSTERGVGFEDDDFYRVWPHIISEKEESEGGYLQSLAPRKELALFLHARGVCLCANGRLREGYQWQVAASRLMPHSAFIREKLVTTEKLLRRAEAIFRQQRQLMDVNSIFEEARRTREASDQILRGFLPQIEPGFGIPVQPARPSLPGLTPPIGGGYQDPRTPRPGP